jgi:hypothetical protein
LVEYKFNLIRDLLPLKGKPLRQAIDQIVLQKHYLPNGKKSVGSSSLYRWIREYKQKGLIGLVRRGRDDAGLKRIELSGKFDKNIKILLTKQQYIEIKYELDRKISSLFAEGHRSGREIHGIVEKLLQKVIKKVLGRDLTQKEYENCIISKEYIYDNFQAEKVVGVKKTDRHKYNREIKPRIKRNREGLLPNDVWFGDVHPVDIQCRRKDGSIIHARQISWLDAATNRIFSSFVFFPKKKGVRRTDVAKSFVEAVKQMGLPKLLYLDNGQEYKWSAMLEGFTLLSKLAHNSGKSFNIEVLDSGERETFFESQGFVEERLEREDDNVIRALKSNPQAKPIESTFRLLENKYFSKIEGWIGGDRLNKKLETVGKAAKSYTEDFDTFQKDIELQIRLYHGEKQSYGFLKGISPNAQLQDFQKKGWKPVSVEEQTLLLAFSEKKEANGKKITRQVYAGGHIKYAPKGLGTFLYQNDELSVYSSKANNGKSISLEILVPTHDPRMIFVKKPDGNIIIAKKTKSFNILDPAGIEEQTRMEKALNAQLSIARKNCSFVNNEQITEALLETVDPEPALEFDVEIEIATNETKKMEEALKQIAFEEQETLSCPDPLGSVEDFLWLDEET